MSLEMEFAKAPTPETETAIREVLARYCRGIDRADAELVASAYWPEAEDRHGCFDGNAHEFARFIGPFLAEHYTLTQHLLGQSLIRVEGDIAKCETYFSSRQGKRGGDVPSVELVSGRYVDRMERRNGEWRIGDRQLILDFVFDAPQREAIPGSVYGAVGRTDTSYQLFNQ